MAASKRVGIAKTLVHHLDWVGWPTFFEKLGCTVVYTEESSMDTFKKGYMHAVSDDCFPIKLYFGHVCELKDSVDLIFIPQLVSLEKNKYICPKLIGLPMVIKNIVPDLPPVKLVTIDMHDMKATLKSVRILCNELTNDKQAAKNALEHFKSAVNTFPQTIHRSAQNISSRIPLKDGKVIGVIGHDYALNDPMLNMNIISRINEYGYECQLSDTIEAHTAQAGVVHEFGYRHTHWSTGIHMTEAAAQFKNDDSVVGVVFLTFFGCGIDAFTEEIFKDSMRDSKPYLSLTIDEHTGEAGFLTRLEAFLDMIQLMEKGAI